MSATILGSCRYQEIEEETTTDMNDPVTQLWHQAKETSTDCKNNQCSNKTREDGYTLNNVQSVQVLLLIGHGSELEDRFGFQLINPFTGNIDRRPISATSWISPSNPNLSRRLFALSLS